MQRSTLLNLHLKLSFMTNPKISRLIKSLESKLETLELDGAKVLSISKKTQTSLQTNPGEPASSPKDALIQFKNEVNQCVKCGELAKSRHSVVFGAGNAKAKLVFVGEAPGHDEDEQGLPFVGSAGQLLTKMIEAMGMSRKDVFICNVLKCRPPQNRNPNPEEIINCSPYLWRQLDLIQPKIICALGKFAAQTLLSSTQTISQLRGNVHDCRGFKLICTFHPAYLLRNPTDKRKAWDDLKKVKAELEKSV